MTTPTTSLDDEAKKATTEAIIKYVASEQFKDKIAIEYKQQITDLIKRAETGARLMAGLAGLLVLAVFSALLLLQYADIRTKQADLYEKYTTGNELVARINTQATNMADDVQTKLKVVQDLKTRLGQLETRLATAEAASARIQRQR